MAENEVTTRHHAFMEVLEPSDINLPLVSENLPDDVILISTLTPQQASIPALEQHQLWTGTDCGVSSKTDEPFSVKAGDSVTELDPLFGSELSPTGSMHRSKVETCECSECSQVFKTMCALNKHLLTHQLERTHVCNICQKEFKHHDHLTGHMLTHQKRIDYRCCQPGCQKMYSGYRSLKRHCAMEHGTYLLPLSFQPSIFNTQPSQPLWETQKLPALKDSALTSANYHSYVPPSKPCSVFQFKGYTDCGTSHKKFTLAADLNLRHKTEDSNLSKVKLPVIPQSGNMAAGGTSCSLESAIDLSASHSMVMSNEWASTSSLGGGVVDQVKPETCHTWERKLDFSVTNLQTWNKAASVEPSKEVTSAGTASQPTLACHRRNPPILLKLDMRKHEPQRRRQASLMSGEASSSKLNILGSSAHHTEPIIPPLHSARKFKPKRRTVKKIMKATNIPTPPLPSPRPSTRRRPRPRPAHLVSPSQVAMVSFSKERALSDTLKSTAQGGSAAATTRNGRKSDERMHLKYSPSRHAQSSPSCSQASTTSTISSIKGGGVDTAGDCYQADQEVQLFPLVIPVSVPVSSKEAPFNPASGHTIEKQQNVKHLSKKPHHPGLLKSMLIPNLTERGYLSQLRSPTYLADHLLYVDPPPYTPPPMLSPLRPGTGLYFNTLPQLQPCLPPPSIYSASLADFSSDGKDGISLTSHNTVVGIKPKINVGSRFQAEIPPLRNPLLILYDEHPAQLVWTPWGDLPTNPETQQKVTEFLDLCCSSVLPGGGTNTELAIHSLHEVQGDILAALDLLLVRGDYRTSFHSLCDYHYTGSDQWTAQEMRLFQKVLLNQTKDFHLIQKTLQTKSMAQCVEYYYTMKKVKKFKQRYRGLENTDGAGKTAESQSATDEQNDETGSLSTYQRKYL